MKLISFGLILLFPVLVSAADGPVPPTSAGWSFTEIRRFAAPEARQGVATDDGFLYVISNHALGKYRKDTGVRVASWECPEGDPLIHLNAGIVHDGRLYCAHSNFPGVPNLSSVEIWDTATLQHVGSHSFGRADGSFTWLDRYNNHWVACFAHYTGKGAEPGKGAEWTRLVEFDDEWRQTGAWAFPNDLLQKLAARGFSVSGGAFGPGGLLFVTGHDDAFLYVLQMPDAGPTLKWVASIPISVHGQAFSWDAQDSGVLYSVSKVSHEVIVGRVTCGSDASSAQSKRGTVRVPANLASRQ